MVTRGGPRCEECDEMLRFEVRRSKSLGADQHIWRWCDNPNCAKRGEGIRGERI